MAPQGDQLSKTDGGEDKAGNADTQADECHLRTRRQSQSQEFLELPLNGVQGVRDTRVSAEKDPLALFLEDPALWAELEALDNIPDDASFQADIKRQ